MSQITPIELAMRKYEERICGKFRPDRRFYLKVGINQKRFGQLMRQEKPIYLFEAQRLSDFFGVPLADIVKNESPIATGNSVGPNAIA
ncbi:hypothetical protein [Dyadobacter sp. OTU695]|uniref:hypothetical protein n=1 Tax=Dyadobacter sp. OTU695 TaxID=3043860 RepID=UPI00313D163C